MPPLTRTTAPMTTSRFNEYMFDIGARYFNTPKISSDTSFEAGFCFSFTMRYFKVTDEEYKREFTLILLQFLKSLVKIEGYTLYNLCKAEILIDEVQFVASAKMPLKVYMFWAYFSWERCIINVKYERKADEQRDHWKFCIPNFKVI